MHSGISTAVGQPFAPLFTPNSRGLRSNLASAEGLSFRPRLENVRRQIAFCKPRAKLEAHECACGVARGTRIVPVLQVRDHREVCIAHHRIEVEAIIVGDERDFLSDRLASRFHLATYQLDVRGCPNLEALEIDKN